MTGITKTFPGVKALSDVNLTVRRGDVHAICGENGAGKSTLMKVLSGVHPHGTYDGTIRFNGADVTFNNIRDSEHAGIVIIHQEARAHPRALHRREHLPRQRGDQARRDRLGQDQQPRARPPRPGRARGGPRDADQEHRCRQAAGSSRSPRPSPRTSSLLILDEPTAALNEEDSRHLLDLIRGLQGRGITSIMISHKAQRDRGHRRRHHDHPRRPDGRDARRARGRRRRGPDHPRHGRALARVALPRPHPRDRRGDVRGQGLDCRPPAGPGAARREAVGVLRPPRRDRRLRGSHGLGPHRASCARSSGTPTARGSVAR